MTLGLEELNDDQDQAEAGPDASYLAAARGSGCSNGRRHHAPQKLPRDQCGRPPEMQQEEAQRAAFLDALGINLPAPFFFARNAWLVGEGSPELPASHRRTTSGLSRRRQSASEGPRDGTSGTRRVRFEGVDDVDDELALRQAQAQAVAAEPSNIQSEQDLASLSEAASRRPGFTQLCVAAVAAGLDQELREQDAASGSAIDIDEWPRRLARMDQAEEHRMASLHRSAKRLVTAAREEQVCQAADAPANARPRPRFLATPVAVSPPVRAPAQSIRLHSADLGPSWHAAFNAPPSSRPPREKGGPQRCSGE